MLNCFFRFNHSLNQYLTGLAEIAEINDETKTFRNIEPGWSSMLGPIINLADILFSSMRMFSR
jgi:hypothetical protein